MIYQSTQHHTTEVSSLHTYHRKNLKPGTSKGVVGIEETIILMNCLAKPSRQGRQQQWAYFNINLGFTCLALLVN
jgi:hypothetical protein